MKVVVYSHDADTRARVRLAIGRRPAPDVPEAEVIEVATHPALIRLLDAGGADVMVLDGEAQPSGGMGVCRQAKDEIYNCPPVLLIIGRADDGWLATWSRADAVVSHPIDPAALAEALAGLMRQRAARPGSPPADRDRASLSEQRPRNAMDAAHSWPSLLGQLINGESLTADAAAWAMSEIMDGAATPAQIAGFGIALRMKGETPGEVDGLASAMLRLATPLSVPGRLTDLVGTGGDRARTVNISTMGAIVAAAAGARVVKHGNRAASSACGAADVLEALGVVIDLPPAATEKLAQETGVVFLFAPLYHPALRHTVVPRRELGVPTVFNFLGPVANPARPHAQAVGVADPRMGSGAGRRAGRPRLLGAGLPRRRRAGRADDHGTVDGLGGPRRRGGRDQVRPC